MAYWIFQGKREDFDIDRYLRNCNYIYWAVKREKHQREMSIGDKVFIWRSKGTSKDPYGVVAFGTIIEVPIKKESVKHPEFLHNDYWRIPEESLIKVGVQIEEYRLNLKNGLVDSSLLRSDKELARMQLLTARQGTNFKLSEEQFERIYQLWIDKMPQT